jgi:hypothetical protein
MNILKICCGEKKSCQIRSEYNVNYLSIEMISNDKSMNYKVVALDESYIFRRTLICIRGSYERNMFF